MAKQAGRQRSQLPSCYHEGYLEKWSFKDQTSQKFWACLCGSSLFFFNEKRDVNYIEKLNLCEFVSLSDDYSQSQNLDAARFNLQMKDGNVKITAPNTEARELWKGFILSVAELYVPSCLNLLPGQIHMMRGVIEKEKERIKNLVLATETDDNLYVSMKEGMPTCFHTVSRLEAELLLDREAKRGNLLLRPRSDGNFAVTTRQNYQGPLFRHYRVSREPTGGFNIVVDNPVHCATLNDIITFLVETTNGVLVPLAIEDHYDYNISFFRPDNESGEVVQEDLTHPVPPPPPPKPVARKTPMLNPGEAPEGRLSLSLNEREQRKNLAEKQDSSAAPLPENKPRKVPLVPSSPAARRSPTPSSSPSPNSRMKINHVPQKHSPLPAAAISELKLKLEQKVKYQQ